MIKSWLSRFLLLSIFWTGKLPARFVDDVVSSAIADGITVNICDPTYENGIIKTDKGGFIEGPGIRIQAMKIQYARKNGATDSAITVSAEDNVMLEYGDYIFVGRSLEYDFETHSGVVYDAKSALIPWYFGGERIDLLADGTYVIHNGFITTSDNVEPDWKICTAEATLVDDQYLHAKDVQFRVGSFPFFWLPSFDTNLKAIFDSPIRYRLRWGGEQGPRVGLIYEFWDWHDLKVFLRADYRLNRGPAGGIETSYCSKERREEWYSINYIARDNSLEERNERTRYRFEGVYKRRWDDDRTTLSLVYDKISDKEMPTDYYDKDLDLGTGQRTQLVIRRQQDEEWIANFCTRVQVNNFETVKQELPNLYTTYHPVIWDSTGIIADNRFSLGFLDFRTNQDVPHPRDYGSGRFESYNRLYRPFHMGPFVHTPEAGIIAIFYTNSPQHRARPLVSGLFGYELNTQLTRFYDVGFKHAIIPYAHYQYFTTPTTKLHEHYIFDIQDGWHRFSMLNVGVRNLIYTKSFLGTTKRCLSVDLFTNVFFDTPTIPSPVPKLYGRVVWDATPSLRYIVDSGWDTIHNQVERINFRTEWTASEDFAIAAEYRHRNAYSWRKADPCNFILESSRPENLLRHSVISDRRDTILGRFFWRFYPNWALYFQSHYGWNRRKEPMYFEYQTDLMTTLPGGWNLKISYQHREDDHRVALYLNLGLPCPVRQLIREEG
jgi:hypothetical protein